MGITVTVKVQNYSWTDRIIINLDNVSISIERENGKVYVTVLDINEKPALQRYVLGREGKKAVKSLMRGRKNDIR